MNWFDKYRKPRPARKSVKIGRKQNEHGNNADQEIVQIFRKEEIIGKEVNKHKRNIKSVAHVKRTLIKTRLGNKAFTAVRTIAVHLVKVPQVICIFTDEEVAFTASRTFIKKYTVQFAMSCHGHKILNDRKLCARNKKPFVSALQMSLQ